MKTLSKKHGKIASFVLCILLLVSSLAACNPSSLVPKEIASEAVAGTFPVTINGVEIAAAPTKVLVLSPSLADIAIELGVEPQLTAAADTCTQYELETLTKISATDISAITGVDADLILTDPLDDSFRSSLSSHSVPVLEITPAVNREDYEALLGEVSAIFKGDGAGRDYGISIGKKLFTTMDDISRATSSDTITTACYLYDEVNTAITGDMFGSLIISYAGMTNIFNSLTGGQYDIDTLSLSNPNVIFCAPGVKDKLMSETRFAKLEAIKNGKVFEMEPYYMQWQGRTIIQAALKLSEYAFPQLIEENSLVAGDPTSKIDQEVESQLASELSAASADTTNYTTLQMGDSDSENDDIYRMQERLKELGYLDSEFDGTFGSYTEDAVKAFQKNNNLTETGIADAETQRALYAAGAKKKNDTASSSSKMSETSESSESSAA